MIVRFPVWDILIHGDMILITAGIRPAGPWVFILPGTVHGIRPAGLWVFILPGTVHGIHPAGPWVITLPGTIRGIHHGITLIIHGTIMITDIHGRA